VKERFAPSGPLAPSERRGEGCRGEGSFSRIEAAPHPCTPLPSLRPGRGDRFGAFAILLIGFLACNRPSAQTPAPAPIAPPPKPNLLGLWQGASVVSRTAELDLGHSAVRLIDSSRGMVWVTPAGDPAQSVVLSLPARTRIDRVGLATTKTDAAARDLRIDFSIDGENFNRGVALSAKQSEDEQDVPLAPPAEAQYVRLTTLNGWGPHLLIRDLIVNGAFLAPAAAGQIDGCWSINGQPATFHADRAAVTGYAGGTNDMTLDGGSDGRFYRFAWTRDKQYGLAAISVTPDGKHLSAIVWHEQAIDFDSFYADDWLGDRGSCPAAKENNVFATYLERFGYFPLYALRFSDDGTLDPDASAPELARLTKLIAANPQLQMRFVAHELTHANARENLAVAEKKVVTLRSALSRGLAVEKLNFIALGEQHPRREGTNPLVRAMYSSVDLELRR
jgi:hypothetical protein